MKEENEGMFAIKDLTGGQLNAIVKKLGGKEGAIALLRGELVVQSKKAAAHIWKTWKTIKLGTGLKTADDFRKALKAGGFKISDWVNDILGKPAFKAASQEVEIELVKISVKELGFPEGASLKRIYAKAQELGLKPCPPEVGPQLRLQYKNKSSVAEYLFIAMEPILAKSWDGALLEVLLIVQNDGGGNYNLDNTDQKHGHKWIDICEFIFCK